MSTKTVRIKGDYTTDGAVDELRRLIERGEILPAAFQIATLRYNAHMGLGREETAEFYPLKFYSADEELWMGFVTAGYGGTGPHGTLKALELMGFQVNEKIRDIVLKKTVTDEIFTK